MFQLQQNYLYKMITVRLQFYIYISGYLDIFVSTNTSDTDSPRIINLLF